MSSAAGAGGDAGAGVGIGISAGVGYGGAADTAYAAAAATAAAASASAAAAAAAGGAVAGAAATTSVPKAKRTNLDEAHRHAVIAELLRTSIDGAIQKGAFTRVAAMFNTNRHTIASLWKLYVVQKSDGVLSPNLRSKRVGKCGRKRTDWESLTAAVPEIPLKDRATQRTFAAALGIPRSTFRNNLKRLGLRTSKGSLKLRLDKERRGGAPTAAEVPGGSQEVLDAAQPVTRV